MRILSILFLIVSLPFLSNSQTLKGKLYDATTTIKGVKVYNKTQHSVTATDAKGNFSIIAKVNDTLVFESLFHHPKLVTLTKTHFEDIAVFELTKIINQLDEVELLAEPEQPVFEEKTYNVALKNLIAEDIKRNPHKYQRSHENYGVDFIYLFKKVFDLVKRKKYKSPIYQPIGYKQLDSLFKKSALFNDDLLIKDLKIPKINKYLFFDFCEAKQISSELLLEKNKMQLLDELVSNSQLFLILLEEYGEEKTVKD